LGDLFENALLAESKGRWQDAVGFYQEAIQFNPENPVLRFNLGNTLYALGRLEGSRDSFRSALKLDASYAEAWNNLGNIYLELEQWKEAIEAFGEALKLVSHYQDAKQNLDLALALLADRRRTKIYHTPS
jgi:tetratricopeptide (TPR) repeat protein